MVGETKETEKEQAQEEHREGSPLAHHLSLVLDTHLNQAEVVKMIQPRTGRGGTVIDSVALSAVKAPTSTNESSLIPFHSWPSFSLRAQLVPTI